jgi:UDP-N-acetylglucosamine acyltransferase
MNIHPLALISPAAKLGRDVQLGPYCVVEEGVEIGDDSILESRVTIKTGTKIGPKNHIFEGAILGSLPQHIHATANAGMLVLGRGNVIRENVTIHRALKPGAATVIGDDCLLMVNAHVAHDCHLGERVILTNNVMLAGHVTVGSQAFLSGAVGVHQFCRVGRLAMVGGQAHLSRDVPPFVTIDGESSYVVGLNQIGLRRAGYSPQVIAELKNAYRLIFRSEYNWKEMLVRLKAEFTQGLAAEFHPFLIESARGIVPERRMPPRATLKIHADVPEHDRVSRAG